MKFFQLFSFLFVVGRPVGRCVFRSLSSFVVVVIQVVVVVVVILIGCLQLLINTYAESMRLERRVFSCAAGWLAKGRAAGRSLGVYKIAQVLFSSHP